MKSKYLIILVLALLGSVISVSVAYFGALILNNNINPTTVTTGNLDLKISDTSLNATSLEPIYDKNYLTGAYKKEFSITNNGSLNSCSYVYLKINDISESLKSKFLKYKIVSSTGKTISGNFSDASTNEDFILINNTFFESNESNQYTLYIWISYQENVNQLDMLGSHISANIGVSSFDSKTSNTCKSILKDYIKEGDIIRMSDNCYQVLSSSYQVKLMYYGNYENHRCNRNYLPETSYGDTSYLKSDVKKSIDLWYNDNIVKENDTSKIVDAAFSSEGENYSVSVLNGDGLLTYPVGIITREDISEYNLSFDENIWLMNNYDSSDMYAYVGSITHKNISEKYKLIPTLYIKNNIYVINGNGIEDSPYKLES